MKMDKSKPLKSFSKKGVNNHMVENKFELIKCPRNGKNCKMHLVAINQSYNDSDYYYQNKEYEESIEALNSAFNKTFELNEETCTNCARTFRYTIIQTLQSIHMELDNMTNGFFKKNRYKSSYILAGHVLDSLRSKGD